MYNIDNRQLIATYATRTRKRENRQVSKKHYVLNLYQRVFQIRVDHTKKPSTIFLQKNSIMLKLMCLIITFFFKMLLKKLTGLHLFLSPTQQIFFFQLLTEVELTTRQFPRFAPF